MTQITVSEFTIPNYQGAGSTASLRIFADKKFKTSSGQQIQKSKIGGDAWYKSVACTVAGNVITVPAFTIDTTTDSDTPSATYSAALFDAGAQYVPDPLFERFAVPTILGSPITYSQLVDYQEIPDNGVTTLAELESLIASVLADTVDIAFPRSQLAANIAFQNDAVLGATALAVNVTAAGNYRVRGVLMITGGAGNFQCNLAGGTATMTNMRVQYRSMTSAGVADAGGVATGLITTFVTSVGGATFVLIDGSIEVNAGGTIILQAAQGSSNASTTTLLRGSYLELCKTN